MGSRTRSELSIAMLFLLCVLLTDVARGSDGGNFSSDFIRYVSLETEKLCGNGSLCFTEGEEEKRRVPLCAMCHCDDQCFAFKDCCVDKYLAEVDSAVPVMQANITEKNTTVACPSNIESVESYFMVTSCPRQYENASVQERCLNTSTEDWHSSVPVADDATGLAYRNQFCAACNDVSHFTFWPLTLTCWKNGAKQHVRLRPLSSQEFMSEVKKVDCWVAFTAPQRGDQDKVWEDRPCTHSPTELINRCNVTGAWGNYDARIEKACNAYTSVFGGRYRNIFCFHCNMGRVISPPPRPGSLRRIPFRFFAMGSDFTALLNTREDERNNVGSVRTTRLQSLPFNTLSSMQPPGGDESAGGISSTEGEDQSPASTDSLFCRPLNCAGGRRLIGKECHPTGQWLYQVCVTLTVTFDPGASRAQQCDFHMLLRVFHFLPVSRVRTLGSTFTFVQNTSVSNLTVLAYDIVYTIQTLGKSLSIETQVLEFVSLEEYTFFRCLVKTVFSPECAVNETEAYSRKNATGKMVLSPIQLCPRIRLAWSETEMTETSSSLRILPTNTSLGPQEFTIVNDSVSVCWQEQFENSSLCSSNISTEDYQRDVQKDLRIIAFACACVSMFFLLVTFLILCLLPDLRTTAGVCNMFVIALLFLAQAVTQFGPRPVEDVPLCAAVGALKHFLWLSTSFWMNAALFVMFYRLVFPLSARFSMETTRKVISMASVYAFGMPAIIVGMCLMTSLYVDGDVGYVSSEDCYLSHVNLRRYAMVLPVAVLFVVNLLLYAATLIHLRRNSREGVSLSHGEHKLSLVAYLKMSVMTGMYWMLALLYEASRYVVFAYMFNISIGLYGVVIFFVLINNRAFSALRERFSSLSSSSKVSIPASVHLPHSRSSSTSSSQV